MRDETLKGSPTNTSLPARPEGTGPHRGRGMTHPDLRATLALISDVGCVGLVRPIASAAMSGSTKPERREHGGSSLAPAVRARG